jgi:hypothetical protein
LDSGKNQRKNVFKLGGFRYDISKLQGGSSVPVNVFRVKTAASEPLKRVTGRMFRISK